MDKYVYAIRKTITNGGKRTHILMNDGSEVLEMDDLKLVTKFVDVLNDNTDSGWVYEIVTIKKVR